MTPIERAARALYQSAPHDFDANQMGEDATWPDLVEQVRAVITAILEPSDAMLRSTWIKEGEHRVASDYHAVMAARDAWQAMIATALEETA